MFGAFLLGWPCVAEDQQAASHTANHQATQSDKAVQPTHVVIDPPLPPSSSKPESSNGQEQTPEKPLPRYERPEWVIVYVTIVYAFIAWRTLRAIRKQADITEQQAADARKSATSAESISNETLKAIKRQGDWMRLSAKAQKLSAKAAITGAKAALESAHTASTSINAMINKERARLRIIRLPLEDKPLHPGYKRKMTTLMGVDTPPVCLETDRFGIAIHNDGETSGYNVSAISTVEVIAEFGKVLLHQSISTYVGVLGSNKRSGDIIIPLFGGIDQEVLDEIHNAKANLSFYGVVKYDDAFEKERVSEFNYIWNTAKTDLGPPFGSIDTSAWIDGPPGSNRTT